jgi:hypothetical protein
LNSLGLKYSGGGGGGGATTCLGSGPAKVTTACEHLKTLTPDKMTTVHRNGKTYYVYADPTKMQIYVGTQAENKRYQQLRKANNLAEEKSYSEAMGDWGPWEPFGY